MTAYFCKKRNDQQIDIEGNMYSNERKNRFYWNGEYGECYVKRDDDSNSKRANSV